MYDRQSEIIDIDSDNDSSLNETKKIISYNDLLKKVTFVCSVCIIVFKMLA